MFHSKITYWPKVLWFFTFNLYNHFLGRTDTYRRLFVVQLYVILPTEVIFISWEQKAMGKEALQYSFKFIQPLTLNVVPSVLWKTSSLWALMFSSQSHADKIFSTRNYQSGNYYRNFHAFGSSWIPSFLYMLE